jgi:hypothetical protein
MYKKRERTLTMIDLKKQNKATSKSNYLSDMFMIMMKLVTNNQRNLFTSQIHTFHSSSSSSPLSCGIDNCSIVVDEGEISPRFE